MLKSRSATFRQVGEPSRNSLPGPENITRVRLPNGVTVLSRANFNSPSVIVQGYLEVGSLFDPDEKLGLADFTAAALMRGTEQRTFQQIYETLEPVGASLGLGGGTHTTGFSGKALAEDLGLLLGVLAEVLRQPSFPADQVERLRAQLLTGLAIRAQDTSEMASMAFDQIVYASHPYSRPDDGYPETVQAISREDLVAFQRKYYGPRGLAIAVVGGIDPSEAVDQVALALGDWQNPGQPVPPKLPPVHALTGLVEQKVKVPDKSQADIMLGAAGPSRFSPDYWAASLGNNVLGQFGMMGRIGEVVRQQAGLAYYASSSLGGGLGPSPWSVSAGVDPANIERVADLVRRELARFVTQPVSVGELADSQANYVGSMPLALESNGGVAAGLTSIERYNLGLDYYRRYPDLVNAVTPEQVLETARRYLDPERLAIAVAGP